MLLHDLSSAITQRCFRRNQVNTEDDFLEVMRENSSLKESSIEVIKYLEKFKLSAESIKIGCISIFRFVSSSYFVVSATGRSETDVMIILPAVHGGSRLILDDEELFISTQTGLIRSRPARLMRHEYYADSEQIMIFIPRAEIEIICAELIGYRLDIPVQFFPVIEGRFSTWLQILSTAIHACETAKNYDLIRQNLEKLVISGLLLNYQNNYSDTFAKSTNIPLPRTVRRAINFMEERIEGPISIAMVASHAGVGVRALQLSFRKYMGASPGEWLCDRRLDRAHTMLMEEETTVTQAALAWGFNDLSDFSGRYQKRYGYLPSKTPKRR